MKYLLTIMLILLSVAPTSASTLVSENFDDQAYVSPLNYYNVTGYNQNIIYDSTNVVAGIVSSLIIPLGTWQVSAFCPVLIPMSMKGYTYDIG